MTISNGSGAQICALGLHDLAFLTVVVGLTIVHFRHFFDNGGEYSLGTLKSGKRGRGASARDFRLAFFDQRRK